MQGVNTETKPRSRHPSSLACLPCRRRHLKCDAAMPACSRCQSSRIECQYIRSKRGLRSKNKNHSSQLLDDDIPLFPDISTDALDWLDATVMPTDLEVYNPWKCFLNVKLIKAAKSTDIPSIKHASNTGSRAPQSP